MVNQLAGVPLVVGQKDERSVHRVMSTLDHDCLDAETILNELCASKINASISWIGDGGFHLALGDPPQAEGWAFSTIGAAAISTWVGEEQRSPWGPGRFCIAASAAASPYMRSGPTGGPHHNASCTRRCPGERDPPETRRL